MIYSINPTKDATLYSNSASMNTGLDEILEVAKVMETDTTWYINRALVQFDLSTIPLGTSVSGSRKFYLKLYVTEPENLPMDYQIDVAAVSQEWTMGQGKRFNTPQTTEGVNWTYKSGDTVADWWASGSENVYGGTWFSGSGQLVTQSFSYQTADLNADVTPIVEMMISGTLANYGFMVKFPFTYEFDSDTYGTVKFFSKDSNTVYKPKLILKYDDSTNAYGAGTLNADDTVVYVKGVGTQHTTNTVDKIRVIARDRYPARTFQTTQSAYVSFNYLPTSSYYGVKDVYTGEMVVDFDSDYTKLSADGSGNYFNFHFGTLFSNRIYKMMFKVVRGDLTQYFDNDIVFRVVK